MAFQLSSPGTDRITSPRSTQPWSGSSGSSVVAVYRPMRDRLDPNVDAE
jgi:hypothetical protein